MGCTARAIELERSWTGHRDSGLPKHPKACTWCLETYPSMWAIATSMVYSMESQVSSSLTQRQSRDGCTHREAFRGPSRSARHRCEPASTSHFDGRPHGTIRTQTGPTSLPSLSVSGQSLYQCRGIFLSWKPVATPPPEATGGQSGLTRSREVPIIETFSRGSKRRIIGHQAACTLDCDNEEPLTIQMLWQRTLAGFAT